MQSSVNIYTHCCIQVLAQTTRKPQTTADFSQRHHHAHYLESVRRPATAQPVACSLCVGFALPAESCLQLDPHACRGAHSECMGCGDSRNARYACSEATRLGLGEAGMDRACVQRSCCYWSLTPAMLPLWLPRVPFWPARVPLWLPRVSPWSAQLPLWSAMLPLS